MEKCEYGDILYLANADYIEKSLADGIFLVRTSEELASFNYFVNTSLRGQNLTMQLQNDIDLAGYKWAPMGWDNEDEVSITVYGWGGVENIVMMLNRELTYHLPVWRTVMGIQFKIW